MNNLLRSLRESRTTKVLGLAGILSSCVALSGGCANVDPDAAMATTAAGILFGGVAGTAAQAAVGHAIATSGAMAYSRSSMENAARQVGSGAKYKPKNYVGATYVGPAPEIQQTPTPLEFYTFGAWGDFNCDGAIYPGEEIGKGRKEFNLPREEIWVFLINPPSGNTALRSWNMNGERLGEKMINMPRGAFYCAILDVPGKTKFPRGNVTTEDSPDNPDFLDGLRNQPAGDYKLTATLSNGQTLALDITITRDE